MATESLEESAVEATVDEGYNITLDMTIPEVAEGFAKCEAGEVLTVVSKDDAEIVLSKEVEEAVVEEEVLEEEPKSAVGRLMAKKMAG